MGHTQLMSMLDEMDMDNALLWHMKYNCYPSIEEFIDVAKLAIELAQNEEYNTLIDVADITGNPRMRSDVPVYKLMDMWRLWDFVQEDDYDEEDCD